LLASDRWDGDKKRGRKGAGGEQRQRRGRRSERLNKRGCHSCIVFVCWIENRLEGFRFFGQACASKRTSSKKNQRGKEIKGPGRLELQNKNAGELEEAKLTGKPALQGAENLEKRVKREKKERSSNIDRFEHMSFRSSVPRSTTGLRLHDFCFPKLSYTIHQKEIKNGSSD